MKKIITVCVLSILLLAGVSEAGMYNSFTMKSNPASSYSVWIKIILNFHRPKTQCQTGFGICLDFEFGADKAAGLGTALCQAMARISPSGRLELKIAESDLQKYESAFALPYFQKGTITLEDAYTFSDPVTRLLGIDRQITVKPGSYPVVYDPTAQTYVVSFPI